MSAIIPRISTLSPLVTRVLGCNPSPMTLQGTNTYLVGSGAKRVLIDAGQGGIPEYKSGLAEVLAREGCTVEKIILTHWHQDHTGGVSDVLSTVAPRPSVHKFPMTEDLPIPGVDLLTDLTDGQTISVEGANMTVLHTPGHTTDHVVLHLREENVLFSGDCILGEGTAVFESLYHYMLSLERILQLRPQAVYPGHGPVVPDPVQRVEYYIKHRQEREQQILDCVRGEVGGITPRQVVSKVYSTTPVNLHGAAQVNVVHHLEKLIQEGRVARKGDKFSCLE